MPVPEENETFDDGAVGFPVGSADDTVMAFGVAAGGTVNTVYTFTDEAVAKSVLIAGPLLKWVIAMLAGGKEKPVGVCRVTGSVAGACGSVTSGGTSPPSVTATGAAYDTWSVKVQIIQAGNRGTATFKYSLDNGVTWSQEIVTAATYLIPNTNVTLGFATGTPYSADNVYTFSTTEPGYVLSDLSAAYDGADTDDQDWEMGHVLGQVGGMDDATKASNFLALITGMSAKIDASQASHRFRWLMFEAPDVADTSAGDTALNAGTASFAEPRFTCAALFMKLTSPDDGWRYRRHAAWGVMYRLRQLGPDADPAAVGAAADGALPSWMSINIPGAKEHNEALRQGLPRFATLRTIAGETGTFVTNAPLFSAPGSDYRWVQHRRLIDLEARLSRRKAIRLFLSQKVSTYSGTPGQPATEDPSRIAGTIREDFAVAWEQELDEESYRNLTLRKMVQWVKHTIDRNEIIETSEDLKYKSQTKAFTYPKAIDAHFGFAP